jgi:hypothetical protein
MQQKYYGLIIYLKEEEYDGSYLNLNFDKIRVNH